jgi:hypothetical protein
MVLVGNKTDLHMDRCVTTEEGKALAEEMKAVFLETSAKENRVRCYVCLSSYARLWFVVPLVLSSALTLVSVASLWRHPLISFRAPRLGATELHCSSILKT